MNGIASRRASRFATFILPALFLAGCFGEGSGPEPIAGTPAPPPPPAGFCDPVNFEPECPAVSFIPLPDGGFEGGQGTLEPLASLPPGVAAGNTSVNVAQLIKRRADSGFTYGGSTISLGAPFEVVAGSSFTALVYSQRPVNVLFQPVPP